MVERDQLIWEETIKEKESHERKLKENEAAMKSNSSNQTKGGKKFTTDQNGKLLLLKSVNVVNLPA